MDTKYIDLLGKAAAVTTRRHEVIARNIANVDTPNYNAQELHFEDEFSEAMQREGHAGAMRVEPRIESDVTTPARADGNNVVLETEIGKMYRNALTSSVFGQILQAKLQQLRMAIGGR